MDMLWPAVTLFGLGLFHGVNPGMGWLFAVALGIQERNARAVWRALPPLAIGHALAVACALGLAALSGMVASPPAMRPIVGAMLAALGAYRFFRHKHARWAGMKVSISRLTLWSFMMATAHGAGLMVIPVVLGPGTAAVAAAGHHHHTVETQGAVIGPLGASAIHSAGYLLVTALLAWVVYSRVGLAILRSAWVNLDAVWAAALFVTGVLTLVG